MATGDILCVVVFCVCMSLQVQSSPVRGPARTLEKRWSVPSGGISVSMDNSFFGGHGIRVLQVC